MTTSTLVPPGIDPDIQEQAAAVLAEIGLTISDAVRSMLILTARQGITVQPVDSESRDDCGNGRCALGAKHQVICHD